MCDELAVGRVPNPQAVSERDDPAGLDPDEGRDRRVGALLAEERVLEQPVGLVEGVVVPVEAAACLGDVRDEWEQDRSEERVVGVGGRVGAREDRGGGLAAERLSAIAVSPRARRRPPRASTKFLTSGRYS